MKRVLSLLFVALFACITTQAQPSVESIFSDYEALDNAEHYEVTNLEVINSPFSSVEKNQRIPDFETWAENLKSVKTRDGDIQIWIIKKDDKVRFIRISSKKFSDHDTLYRISKDSVALILPRKDGSALWTNELGYYFWIWRYDETGKLIKKDKHR